MAAFFLLQYFYYVFMTCRIEEDLKITTPEGWYAVTRQDILDRGGHGLLQMKVRPS
jgi:hypothetical protein